MGIRHWPIETSSYRGPKLLLLRVFGFQRRTENLFDAVGQQWRLRGPVMMIAGADLAMRTIDPGDTVRFVGGRLMKLFIRDEQNLQERLFSQDVEPDPDGRFRLAKFFCYEDTWQPTLVALLDRSDAVLVDLRGFSTSNRGILFELEQLVSRDLLSRTLMIVDDATDVALLNETVREQAGAVGKEMHPLHITHVRKQSHAELKQVSGALRAMTQAPRSGNPNVTLAAMVRG
jgi:hypothetical protein